MRPSERLCFGAALAGLAIGLLACGSSSGGRRESDASADGAPLDGGSGAEAGPTGAGIISFTNVLDGGGTLYAVFTDPAPKGPTDCTIVEAGACSTASCPKPPAFDAGPGDAGPGDAGPGDAGFTPAPNPGIMTITGGLFGSGTHLGPDKLGTYLYQPPGPVFAPGDELGVSAPGARLPGFSKQTVVAPATVVLTAPAPTGGKLVIAAGHDLTVSWTGGESGDALVLTAAALFTTGDGATMTCNWDASAGTAVVPSAALRPLAAANALASSLLWYQVAQKRFTAGTVAVTISAFLPQASLATFQ